MVASLEGFFRRIGLWLPTRYRVRDMRTEADSVTHTAFLERPAILSESVRPSRHTADVSLSAFEELLFSPVRTDGEDNSKESETVPHNTDDKNKNDINNTNNNNDNNNNNNNDEGNNNITINNVISDNSHYNNNNINNPMDNDNNGRNENNGYDHNRKGNMPPRHDKMERQLSFLIVDDSVLSRKTTSRLLTSLGHRAEVATDGIDFLQQMGGHADAPTLKAVDIVLMDDNMPNLNGPEAAAAIRQRGFKGVIVAVTGNGFDSQVEHFLSKGADRVLLKPLKLQELDSIVREMIPGAVVLSTQDD